MTENASFVNPYQGQGVTGIGSEEIAVSTARKQFSALHDR
jgi:hypothetical protein